MRDIEEEIYQAAVEAREYGLAVCQGAWIDDDYGACCPLTALILKRGKYDTGAGLTFTPGALLGCIAEQEIPLSWCATDFTEGFDGAPLANGDPSPAWLCGRSVGRRLGFTYDDSWMEPSSEDD